MAAESLYVFGFRCVVGQLINNFRSTKKSVFSPKFDFTLINNNNVRKCVEKMQKITSFGANEFGQKNKLGLTIRARYGKTRPTQMIHGLRGAYASRDNKLYAPISVVKTN